MMSSVRRIRGQRVKSSGGATHYWTPTGCPFLSGIYRWAKPGAIVRFAQGGASAAPCMPRKRNPRASVIRGMGHDAGGTEKKKKKIRAREKVRRESPNRWPQVFARAMKRIVACFAGGREKIRLGGCASSQIVERGFLKI